MEPCYPPAQQMSMTASRISGADLARHLDLLVLAIALPVFIAAEAPIAGYLAAAAAWLAGRAGKAVAERRREQALAAANRNAALGLTAATMLGRLWVLAAAILIVGLLVDREAGLGAAVLSAALVTAHLGGEGVSQLLGRGREGLA